MTDEQYQEVYQRESALIKSKLTPEFLETVARICESPYDFGVDLLELISTYNNWCELAGVQARELRDLQPEELL